MLKNSLYSVRHQRRFAEKFFALFVFVSLMNSLSLLLVSTLFKYFVMLKTRGLRWLMSKGYSFILKHLYAKSKNNPC